MSDGLSELDRAMRAEGAEAADTPNVTDVVKISEGRFAGVRNCADREWRREIECLDEGNSTFDAQKVTVAGGCPDLKALEARKRADWVSHLLPVNG
jgi:hypothetical protein